MRASRIFVLARTIRWASVGAGVRNARPISSVVSPHTSRRVSATCASGASGGMAAGENQAKPVVFDRLCVGPRGVIGHRDVGGALGLVERVEPLAAAQRVDRLEAAGRHEPGARIRRNAVARPLLERRSERVVQGLLGDVEVTQQTDQRGEHTARFGEIDGAHRLVDVVRRHSAQSHHLQWSHFKRAGSRHVRARRRIFTNFYKIPVEPATRSDVFNGRLSPTELGVSSFHAVAEVAGCREIPVSC